MRRLIFFHFSLLVALGSVTPLRAQLNETDLIQLGIQILNGANGADQQPSPNSGPQYPPAYSTQPRQLAPQPSPQELALVAEVQRRLNELGYPVGTVDGRAGSRTRGAIADFQRDHGLPQTGRANQRLLDVMRAAQSDTIGPAPSPALSSARPSFDCSAVRQAAERAICASSPLAALDRDLARAYSTSVASGATTPGAQRQWIARRNGCGGNSDCIAAAYQDRLSQLGAGNGFGTASSPSQSEQPGAFTMLEGYDLPGGDYRSGLTDPGLKGIGPETCAEFCAADGPCMGFTYNLRADICILKHAAGQRAPYAGAVSGIKDGNGSVLPGAGRDIAGTNVTPTYSDFVHMALMSDADAYLAEAALTGVNYIRATGTEQQCRQIYDAQQRDEFARRGVLNQAAALARETIAALPTRPRRVAVPIEALYALADYDFDRQGFPFASYQSPKVPILAAGIVPLVDSKRPVFCRTNWGYPRDFGRTNYSGTDFDGLGAEHDAVPGVDFLPMPQDQAQAFRAAGNKILLKATLVVEPRDQGRGPLEGRIVTLAAHDPDSGRLLHRWNILDTPTPTAPQADGTPWTGELLASLIGPTIESRLDRQALDNAATQYFRHHEGAIRAGNLPPQSPLAIEAMRGRQPEVIAALNRDRLRAVLRENTPSLPLAVAIEQRISPYFAEDKGLTWNAQEAGLGPSDDEDSLAHVKLSSRDLPLYERFFARESWETMARQGFRESVVSRQPVRIALELDRIVRTEPVAMGIEQAAARGLVGYSGSSQRDSILVRWELDISGVRAEGDAIVISASLRRLSYRWASDNEPVAEFTATAFATVAGLRQAADATLAPLASAENVNPPPAGTRFGAEMADLLQLRFQPETVDDRVMERMMITRFAYEVASQGEAPLWGSFFRDLGQFPKPDERAARLGEFRAWSEARAAALPASLTISLPLDDTPGGKAAPFERRGSHRSCPSPAGKEGGTLSEKDLARANLCGFLDAAWQSPEPLLYFSEDGVSANYPRDLRYNCDNDPYCTAMYNARVEMRLPHNRGEDIVQLDRLPTLDATTRAMKGRLALEIVVEPTGLSAEKSRPESIWGSAVGKAHAFAESYGVQFGKPDNPQPSSPLLLFQTRAVSARVVDLDTGTIVATPPLAAPAALPLDMLAMPDSTVGTLDVLGIRLGMSFAEADTLIRGHMQVGKVLSADRKSQFGSVSGDIVPYTSGRLYASAEGNELIAIFDEPPAAQDTVLGIWRILRLPRGGTDPAGLKATLTQRYGEPSRIQEVQLPLMKTGLAFLWSDHAHERCNVIDFDFQTGLWQDADGDTSWLPPFMVRPYYPVLHSAHGFIGVTKQPLPLSSFCPSFLGVRYASYDDSNYEQPAGDEIITWLSDNRRYAESFYESLAAPATEPPTDGKTTSKLKF
jgi:peptidoglycan hydrolase-like protein with peptidoglycan-binding domain